MSKEMNKMNIRVVKYDILLSLFLSLIIGIFFGLAMAVVFAMGATVSLINYLLLRFSIIKSNEHKFLVIISSFMRILIIASIVIPLVHSINLVILYIIGFIMHYIVLIYCTITQKGSA